MMRGVYSLHLIPEGLCLGLESEECLILGTAWPPADIALSGEFVVQCGLGLSFGSLSLLSPL